MRTKAPVVDVRLYVGRGGSGKTALMRHHLKNEKRIIILDANGEPEYAAMCEIVTTPSDLIEAVRKKTFKVAVRVPFGSDPKSMFDIACNCAWAAENCVIVWEEVHTYRIGSALPKIGESLVNQGRHRRVRVWAATRRPINLRTLTASCTAIYAFPTTEPNDLSFYDDLMGTGAGDAAKTAGQYSYLQWTEKGYAVQPPAKIL